MATFEKMALQQCVDEAGNKYLLYPVTTINAVDGLPEELESIRSLNSGRRYTATIGTAWQPADGLQVQTIECPGILVSDYPLVDLMLPVDAADLAFEIMCQFDLIHSIHTVDGQLIVYAFGLTDVAINIQLSC